MRVLPRLPARLGDAPGFLVQRQRVEAHRARHRLAVVKPLSGVINWSPWRAGTSMK
jgi:hypothetical protein